MKQVTPRVANRLNEKRPPSPKLGHPPLASGQNSTARCSPVLWSKSTTSTAAVVVVVVSVLHHKTFTSEENVP